MATTKRKRVEEEKPRGEIKKAHVVEEREDNSCAVCLEPGGSELKLIACTPTNGGSGCANKFCVPCLDRWKNAKIEQDGVDVTCPTCRAVIKICPAEKKYISIDSIVNSRSQLFMIGAILHHQLRNHNQFIPRDARVRMLPPQQPQQTPPDGSRFYVCKTCRARPATSIEQSRNHRHHRDIGSIMRHIAKDHPRLRLLIQDDQERFHCFHHPDEIIEPTIESVILHFTSHGHSLEEVEQRFGVKMLPRA